MALSKEQILSIVEKVNKGKSNEDIAKELHTTEKTVISWKKRLREAGYKMPPPSKGGRPPTLQKKQEKI